MDRPAFGPSPSTVGWDTVRRSTRSRGGLRLSWGHRAECSTICSAGTFSLNALKMRVFDEADRMLSMGFYPDMQEVQRHIPRRTLETLHNSMFSATFPPFVMRTSQEFLREPEFISLSGDQVHVTDTEHSFFIVPAMDKDPVLDPDHRGRESRRLPSFSAIPSRRCTMSLSCCSGLATMPTSSAQTVRSPTARRSSSVSDRTTCGSSWATDVAARGPGHP